VIGIRVAVNRHFIGAESPPNPKALSLDASGAQICGRRCLKVEARLGENQGGGLTKWFEPAAQVFVRFYVRFDPGCDHRSVDKKSYEHRLL
jgi:hypothetical protein